MGILSKAAKGLYSLGAQRKLKSKKAGSSRKVQEAQKLAKGADRGKKTEQVAKRVLPKMSGVRKQLQGMSAADIAEEYSGKEITAMIRKVKNPTVLARLQKAKRSREKRMTKFVKGRQGPEYPKEVIQSVDSTKPKGQRVKTTTIPRSGTRAAKLKAKTWKTGGTVKRKSGGKMNTDGNAYVASLYKGGKVGG